MSDRVEERRAEQVQTQKKQADMRTAKEKEAAGQKFKMAFAQKSVLTQKNAADNNKKQGEKQGKAATAQQQKAGGALLARQGIAGRSMAERMVKGRNEASQGDESISNKREKDLHASDNESRETITGSEDHGSEKQFDSAVEQRRDDQQQSKDQGQSQSQGQGGQQNMGGQGQSSGGQGQGQQGQPQDRDTGSIGGVGAAAAKGGAGAVGGATVAGAGSSSSTGKVIIGKSDKTAAKERISPQVLQSIVEKVYQGSQQGMQDFMVQLKDDALGGGSLRVTLKDGKLKIAFTMKEATAKNLLESQKGVLMRMFERKGLALESFEVKVRGMA